MKRFLGLALVAFVSAVAIQGLHAGTTTPPVYVVIEVDEITDANGFERIVPVSVEIGAAGAIG